MTTEETSLVEEAADAEPIERSDDGDGKPRRLKRFAGRINQWLRGKTLAALLALLVVASAALAAVLLYFWYRPDRATDAAAAKSAIAAASEGTVAILSYAPETLDRDLASAKSHLTGDFLSYYTKFTEQIVAPAAKQKSVKTSAVVVRAAVSDLHPDSAVVLVFVNQSTVSADRADPALTSSSVLVTLLKADGKWLISAFDPV
ncbi:MAG: twin-arginine translocation pathway signal [Mycobacterium sp.]|nr:twin-arginine translocation pathway signal [Mycobacterium sp.]